MPVKLQLYTIATKFRQEQEDGTQKPNYMRQYYDVYCLLEHPQVLGFIGTAEYTEHKEKRFPKKDFEIPIAENEAFLPKDFKVRASFKKRYESTKALYYDGQPDFDSILDRIRSFIEKLQCIGLRIVCKTTPTLSKDSLNRNFNFKLSLKARRRYGIKAKSGVLRWQRNFHKYGSFFMNI